jgi:hypothetical protein
MTMFRMLLVFSAVCITILSGCTGDQVLSQPQDATIAAITELSADYPDGTEINVSAPLSYSELEREVLGDEKEPMRRSVRKSKESFLSTIQEGDNVVRYSRICGALCGDEGYAVIRGNKVIDLHQTIEH